MLILREGKAKQVKQRLGKLAARSKQRTKGLFAKLSSIAMGQMVKAAEDGARAFENENPDLILGWIWHTSKFSPEICPDCLAREGRWYPKDTYHERPPLHRWCFCYSLSKPRSLFDMGGEVAGPASLRPYGEWAIDANVGYDGGLDALPISTKGGKWRVRVPREHKPKKESGPAAGMSKARKAAYDWARRNVRALAQKTGWDTEPRYGQESVAKQRARAAIVALKENSNGAR